MLSFNVIAIRAAVIRETFFTTLQVLNGDLQANWDWLAQLSELTQLHVRNAASYHMFYHDANETDGLINRRAMQIETALKHADARGSIDEAKRVLSVMTVGDEAILWS